MGGQPCSTRISLKYISGLKRDEEGLLLAPTQKNGDIGEDPRLDRASRESVTLAPPSGTEVLAKKSKV